MLLNFPVFYLDENLCNCALVLGVFSRNHIACERHLERFKRGALDKDWLPRVGRKGWIVLTTDKHYRYNALERVKCAKYRVRVFQFSAGVKGAANLAHVLETALPEMLRFCARHQAPFIAALIPSGAVVLRWPLPDPPKKVHAAGVG